MRRGRADIVHRSCYLPKLEVLGLAANSIGDDGVKALSSAIASGAMANLSSMFLSSNNISDEGIIAFASAFANVISWGRHGADPWVPKLDISDNNIGDAGIAALAKVISNGALDNLASLSIQRNPFADAGLAAIVEAVKSRSGALANLRWLDLGFTNISDEGLKALAAAIVCGALPSLKMLSRCTAGNGPEHADLKGACNSRGVELLCHIESLS